MIRKMVLLAAFATLLPCLAVAGGVSFTTSGTFSNPSLFPITFTGASYTSTDGGHLSFGTFNVGTCGTKKCMGSETFTLTIDETSPISGTGQLIAKLFGHVKVTGHSKLTLTFTSATITIGSTVYTIPAITETINGRGTTTLNGDVTVPEPNAEFLLGLGALGLVGLVTISRKMVTV